MNKGEKKKREVRNTIEQRKKVASQREGSGVRKRKKLPRGKRVTPYFQEKKKKRRERRERGLQLVGKRACVR